MKPRTRPRPNSLGILALLPWAEVRGAAPRGGKSETWGSRSGCSQATQQGWLWLSPAPGVPRPPTSVAPLLGDTLPNSAGRSANLASPGPEGHCKEPNPLIRTGRLARALPGLR